MERARLATQRPMSPTAGPDGPAVGLAPRAARVARDRPAPTGRALLVAFAAVAITFTSAAVVAQSLVLHIRSLARQITADTSPSVAQLGSLRDRLRVLEVMVGHHVDLCRTGRCVPPRPELAELRRALRAEWDAYQQHLTSAGERDGWPAVDAELERLDGALAEVLAAVKDGRTAEAVAGLSGAVEPACDRLDAAVARLVEFNRSAGLEVAERIDRLARRSAALSLALGLLCLAFTGLAAALSIRFVRRYERLLRRRAEELDQFAGRVAHDVLSPLTGTGLALHLARRGADEKALEALDRGARGVERVTQIVDALLRFARAGARPEAGARCEVLEVLRSVVDDLQPLAAERRVEVRLEGSPCPPVACEAGVLVSVASNLLGNALKYMGDGPVRRVRLRARLAVGGRAVRAEIEDTGPGIPPALGTRIFEPFVRAPDTAQPGTGLGLATAQRIVTAHGGRIGFHSLAGRGTLFWFELPRALAAPRAPEG